MPCKGGCLGGVASLVKRVLQVVALLICLHAVYMMVTPVTPVAPDGANTRIGAWSGEALLHTRPGRVVFALQELLLAGLLLLLARRRSGAPRNTKGKKSEPGKRTGSDLRQGKREAHRDG